MGLWSLYFLGKLYLDLRGHLRVHFVANVLFIALLLLPTPQRFAHSQPFRIARAALAGAIALALVWHDSLLPSWRDTLAFARDNPLPEKEYILSFLRGFVNPLEIAALAVLLGVALLVRHRVRLGVIVALLMCVTPLRGLAGGAVSEIDRYVDEFYRAEAQRTVAFAPPPAGARRFDVVILHVCSLAWDDLQAVGMDHDPFLNEFDVLLTNFNSVTSYSGPAVLRLLSANRGQPRHADLYATAPHERRLFDELRAVGYQTSFVMNHDGAYAHFAQQATELGHAGAPFVPRDLPPQAFNFDGSAIFSDRSVLEHWWATRQAAPLAPAAAYYNTISLHDGAHLAADKDWWKRDRIALYEQRVRQLFADLSQFFRLVEASGRPVLVLFVPEHGIALRGSSGQVAGLRDIPYPRITRIPVGVKWIEGGAPGRGQPLAVPSPTSYLALAALLGDLLRQPDPGPAGLQAAATRLPTTGFLSENQSARVVRIGADTYVSGADQRWAVAPAEATP